MNEQWKWLFDGETVDRPPLPPGIEPMDAGEALAQVLQAEDDLAARARRDLLRAYLDVVIVDDAQPAPAPPAEGVEPATAEMATLGGQSSHAGDAAWTYGAIDWFKDGQPGKGHYVRVWQRRPEGWRIVFDELLAAPPPSPVN